MSKRSQPRREAALSAVEQCGALQSLGQVIASRARIVIRPGLLKDLLSGTWLGHPAHPLLTDLPIGAWASAGVLDVLEVLGVAGGRDSQADTLIALGILAAIPTALSGASDLSDEQGADVLATGAAHALGNTSALVLYAASYLARRRGHRCLGISLGLLGAGAMGASGFLGGHLVFRRGLGVNRTAFDQPIAQWTRALDSTQLTEGSTRMVVVEGREVLLARTAGEIVAMVNRCSHRGGPLNEGTISGDEVTCPWHGGRFCLLDGRVLQGPPSAPQTLFETRVRDGAIEIRTAADAEPIGMG
jgi:nitrite reductase/ring-hydroxylating ferredoxin subunit/uncharacterized membrane protein